MSGVVAFAVAAALHAGFQATVTVLVYPALARHDAGAWVVAHDKHSRGVVPLVAVVYGALLVTGGWALVDGPTVLGWAALAVTACALAVTALAAAPLHGRLATHDVELVRRLLVADRWRCVAAVAGAVLAAAAI